MCKETIGDKIFNVLNILFLTTACVTMIYPLWNLFVVSLSSSGPVLAGEVNLWPKGFDLNTYKILFTTNKMMRSMGNTVYITIVGTAINLFLTVIFAYPLSKKYFMVRGGVLKLMIFTMLFNGGMIANYILIRNLKLMDSFWAVMLPGAISAYYCIIMISFFKSIPNELEEAAKIDGMGDVRILFSIYIPLSMHAIATIALFYSVFKWNTFMGAVLYISDMKKYPLQVMLRQIILLDEVIGEAGQATSDAVLDMPPETKKAASIFFSVIPILCVYPFVQKYFIKGVMIGSVKG